jgi:hypothetical protein
MQRQRVERKDWDVADHGVDLPASPGAGKGPGWYPVGGVNDQAHWDGARWTGRRRWNGASWTEIPLEGVAIGTRTIPDRQSGQATRNWFLIGFVILVAAIGLAAGLVFATSGSTARSNSTSPSRANPATPTSSPVTVPHQTESAVAACEADAKNLEVALEAYMAQNGSFPTPPSLWSAATYSSNFAPLTGLDHGGPWLHSAPATTNYVIEYDASGHVWIAPPGSYGTYNPGQDIDHLSDICLASAG